MGLPTTTLLGGLLCLLLLRTAQGEEDMFERLVPRMQARLEEVRKALVPLPEDTLKEGIYHLGTYYIPLDSISERCRNHSGYMFESFLNNDIWALRMVDASSKLASGVMDGRFMDLGSYDQCLSVEAPGRLFRGQHCIVETTGLLPDMDKFNPERQFLPTMRTDVMFSLCVPSSCSAEDVKAHVDVALDPANASAIVTQYNCSSTLPEPFSLLEWVAILILALIAGLLIASTIYDNKHIRSDKNPLLSAFSLSKNISKMVDTRSSDAALTSLNGLRVLAMCWILIGHRMLYILSFPSMRFKTIMERIDEVALAPVENTQVAVEIFFLMTGILVSYSFLRYRLKSNRPFNVFHFYLIRYLRLTPAFAMMILLYASILVRGSDGPLWRRNISFLRDFCQSNWWANLLYLHNYLTPYELCITQSWYLASDFQLYLFSPVVLIPLHTRPKLGLSLVAGFFTLTTVGALYNAFTEELKAGGAVTLWCVLQNTDISNCDRRTEINQVKDYTVTHLRAASFLMGIALGYLLFQVKQGKVIIKLSKPTLWAGWLLSLFLITFSVFFVLWFQSPDYVYSPVVDTLYLVLHRHMLSLGIAWIILVCTLGYGGPVDKFLSWPVFVPLARLTYCAYLTHVYMQNVQSSNQRNNISLNLTQLHYMASADFMVSYIVGAVLYLSVEAPCANLVNILFQGKKKVNPDQSQGTEKELPVFKYSSS